MTTAETIKLYEDKIREDSTVLIKRLRSGDPISVDEREFLAQHLEQLSGITLRQFNDERDIESWKGTSSAFRNGAKCRLQNVEGNYTDKREDLYAAWQRGWREMDQYLEVGGVIIPG